MEGLDKMSEHSMVNSFSWLDTIVMLVILRPLKFTNDILDSFSFVLCGS